MEICSWVGFRAPQLVLSLTKEGVKRKALLCAAALSRWKRRSLGGVSSETQGRVVRQAHYRLRGVARGLPVRSSASAERRRVRFSEPVLSAVEGLLSFVGQTKERRG